MKNVTLELHEAKICSRKGTYKNKNKNDEKDDKIFVAFEMESIPEKRPFLLSRDFASVRPSGRKVEPFQVFVMWISFVTYLNHHGHEQKLPWYRGVEWNYLKGALTTVDRDYGWFSYIHHHLGTHVIHNLFPQIPHYHLLEATRAAKPVLGMYYREPQKSGAVPFHLISDLVRSLQQDHYVSDNGDKQEKWHSQWRVKTICRSSF